VIDLKTKTTPINFYSLAGWVVGSLDILGSPGGLAQALGSGLKDFISMPFQGLLQGPWGFIVGITHGSASLVKHITAGERYLRKRLSIAKPMKINNSKGLGSFNYGINYDVDVKDPPYFRLKLLF
jgi:hypothetical protein